MMYRKALLFGDTHYAQQILDATTPLQAKRLGRQVGNFDPQVWNQHKTNIVYENNYAKFTQNPHLLTQLLATGNKTLVEASPRDTIWGVGMGVTNPKIYDRRNWRGKNLLGNILTRLRNELRTSSLTQAVPLASKNMEEIRQEMVDRLIQRPDDAYQEKRGSNCHKTR